MGIALLLARDSQNDQRGVHQGLLARSLLHHSRRRHWGLSFSSWHRVWVFFKLFKLSLRFFTTTSICSILVASRCASAWFNGGASIIIMSNMFCSSGRSVSRLVLVKRSF